MDRTQTIIVVPCYNEAQRLQTREFKSFAASQKRCQFLFVNDGSTDATLDVLRELESTSNQFWILDLTDNCGKNEAVRRGMLWALEHEPEYVGYWDADLATPLDAITRFCTCLDEKRNIDLVMGCRLGLLGHNVRRNLIRRILSRCFSVAASTVLGMTVRDTQCGAKLFRANRDLYAVFEHPFHSRWIFDVELISRLKTLQGETVESSILELPLYEWTEIGDSKIKLRDWVIAAGDLCRIAVGSNGDVIGSVASVSVRIPSALGDSDPVKKAA